MVLVHLLALVAIVIVWGAISMCGRRRRKGTVKTYSNTSTQTDPPEHVAARPGAASHGGGPRLRTPQALADLSQDRVYVIGNGERYHKRSCGMVQAALTTQRKSSERSFTWPCHFGAIHCLWTGWRLGFTWLPRDYRLRLWRGVRVYSIFHAP